MHKWGTDHHSKGDRAPAGTSFCEQHFYAVAQLDFIAFAKPDVHLADETLSVDQISRGHAIHGGLGAFTLGINGDRIINGVPLQKIE